MAYWKDVQNRKGPIEWRTTYKIVEANCDAKVMKGITEIIEKYKDNSTKKKKGYLSSFSYNK